MHKILCYMLNCELIFSGRISDTLKPNANFNETFRAYRHAQYI